MISKEKLISPTNWVLGKKNIDIVGIFYPKNQGQKFRYEKLNLSGQKHCGVINYFDYENIEQFLTSVFCP